MTEPLCTEKETFSSLTEELEQLSDQEWDMLDRIKEEKAWLRIEFDGWVHIMLVPKSFDIERLKNSIKEQIND